MKILIWISLSTLLILFGTAEKPKDPVNLKLSSREFADKQEEGVVGLGGCEPCDNRPSKDCESSNIAVNAAQEAKAAQEAQQIAGAQASHQVRAQLAEKAQQAARAAEAALHGKLVFVDQLKHQLREAQAMVEQEAASCQRTQMNLHISLAAAAQAARLLKTLMCSLKISQCNLANSQRAAEGTEHELAEKAALLDAARCRLNALLKELCVARQDLATIKQAACKAQNAARNACSCAQRCCRNKRKKKQALRLLNRLVANQWLDY